MPKVVLSDGTEVDETAFLNNKKLADTVALMLKNPEARRRVLEAQKIVQPDAVIPEIDAAKPLQDALEATTKKFDEALAAIQKEREDEKKEKTLGALKDKWQKGHDGLKASGWTDEGIAGVEKLMEEKGIGSHEDAAIIFERNNPPTEPVSPAYGAFFETKQAADTDEDMKALIGARGESDHVLNKMIDATLRDVRGGR